MFNMRFYVYRLNLCIWLFLSAVLLSAGCSSTSHQLKGPFKYTQSHTLEKSQLRVPAVFDKPAVPSTYTIPNISEAAEIFPIGLEIDPRAPVLVWPVLQGSRVLESDTGSVIELSAAHAQQNLQADTLNVLKIFLTLNQAQIVHEERESDRNALTLVSTFPADVVQGWVNVAPDTFSQQRLTWQLSLNPVLQTVRVKTDLNIHSDDPSYNTFVYQRAETLVLNAFIEYIKQQETSAQ